MQLRAERDNLMRLCDWNLSYTSPPQTKNEMREKVLDIFGGPRKSEDLDNFNSGTKRARRSSRDLASALTVS